MRQPHLVRKPLLGRLHYLVRLPQLVTQPYLGWQHHLTSIPPLGSQPRQAQLLILASLHLAVIIGVPQSWLNGSAGMPAVPATIPCLLGLITNVFKLKNERYMRVEDSNSVSAKCHDG